MDKYGKKLAKCDESVEIQLKVVENETDYNRVIEMW